MHLGRRPQEPTDEVVLAYYRRLLAALSRPVFHDGVWRQVEPREAWAGNTTYLHFVAGRWALETEFRLTAANLSGARAQCYLPLELPELAGRAWLLRDLLSEARYERDGDRLLSPGLYLDVPAYGHHLFEITPL